MSVPISSAELLNKIREAGLEAPETLTLMITGKCNLTCLHCLLNCRENNSSPVPADVVKRMIKEFLDISGKSIWFTGGEPLTRSDWFEILEFAMQYEFEEVGLQTNAMLMTEEDLHRLQTLPLNKLSLQISLDGVSAITHNALRGEGSFDIVMKVLKMLSSTDLACRTAVAFTEMRHNYHELPDAVYLVNNLGLSRLVSGTVVRSGKCTQYGWIELPAAPQVNDLLDKYNNDTSFHDAYEQSGNISAIEWFKGKDRKTDKLCTCMSTPFINSEGELFPCIMYLDKSFAEGNIHEISLAEAILNGLSKWKELPLTADRRSNLPECRECPGHDHCKGGCVGRAAVVNGTPMSVEDRCALRKIVYNWKD
ncbi:MAG: radical SAM protein [Spirochaetes bacterium]|nr:radical SAM protein [Spirochaetota bacterium]